MSKLLKRPTSVLRLLVAAAAMVFLASSSPAAEPLDAAFNACSQCHPNKSNAWCAGLVNYTISSCCGSGNGWAHCVNSEWGFYVDCNGPGNCNCDMWGNYCDNWWPNPVY